MLYCSWRSLSFSISLLFYDTIDSWMCLRIPVVNEKSGEAVQQFSTGLGMLLKFATCNSSNKRPNYSSHVVVCFLTQGWDTQAYMSQERCLLSQKSANVQKHITSLT